MSFSAMLLVVFPVDFVILVFQEVLHPKILIA